MVIRVAIFFAIFINFQFSLSFENETFSDVSEPLNIDDHKIIEECHNEDYRTYLRCLKRQKRHHEITGSSRSCLEDCTINNCTTSKCVHDCYTRCKKKITEIYSKITEVESECSSGKCDNPSLVPNITTNVNLHIGSNATSPRNTTCSPSKPTIERPNDDNNNSSKITINNMITNLQTGPQNSNCICPGCNCWSLFPQITIGFGPGPTGVGCCYPQPCTCYQQSQQNDCSLCGNPFFRDKCGITCQNFNGIVNNTRRVNSATPV